VFLHLSFAVTPHVRLRMRSRCISPSIATLLRLANKDPFSIHVVTFLEYAAIICDAIVILVFMAGDIQRIVRRYMQ
jgi:hypothetical protein